MDRIQSFGIENIIAIVTVLILLFGVIFTVIQYKLMRSNEMRKHALIMGMNEIYDRKKVVEGVLKNVKLRPDPPVPGNNGKTEADLHEYANTFWEDCDSLKEAANTARLFSASLEQADKTLLCKDLIRDVDAMHNEWKDKLANQCIDMKVLNRLKLRAYELLFLLEDIVAHTTMNNNTLIKFRKEKSDELDIIRASF